MAFDGVGRTSGPHEDRACEQLTHGARNPRGSPWSTLG
jgi:hypothetical protein